MRTEGYQRRREELAGWPVGITSYRLGDRLEIGKRRKSFGDNPVVEKTLGLPPPGRRCTGKRRLFSQSCAVRTVTSR